jgi:hypothetical protein
MKVSDGPFQIQTCLLLLDEKKGRFGTSGSGGKSRQFQTRQEKRFPVGFIGIAWHLYYYISGKAGMG